MMQPSTYSDIYMFSCSFKYFNVSFNILYFREMFWTSLAFHLYLNVNFEMQLRIHRDATE